MEQAYSREKMKTEELTAKLSSLSVRNVNKRIKRRDTKIADSQLTIKELESEVLSQADTVSRLKANIERSQRANECSRQKIYRSSKKIEAAAKENEELHTRLELLEELFSAKLASLEDKMAAMQEDLDLAHMERDDLKVMIGSMYSMMERILFYP